MARMLEATESSAATDAVNKMFLARIGIVIGELVAEALLLGILLGILLVPTHVGAWAAGSVAVDLVLYLHGYYLTRPVLGLVWKSEKIWPYGLSAATLFAIHMGVGYARLRPDMMQVKLWVVISFFAGGAAIVLACALIGHRWLAQKASVN